MFHFTPYYAMDYLKCLASKVFFWLVKYIAEKGLAARLYSNAV